jgi:uncharacterized membrane protein (UPF0127 family)
VRLRAVLAALALVACAGESPDLPAAPTGGFDAPVTVTFAGAPPIKAEVARTREQRARGLMQRTSLAEGEGMVFLFAGPVNTGFWMKGTLIPLSIAYVDRDRVVSTHEMAPCTEDPCPTYEPAGPYTLAVEAPGGFFPDHGVKAGTKVTLVGATAAPE